MSADLSKAYELLGVKPGVSIRELKAAHRDLAKVWHPDRFLHDPRLQEKAQEKLKEINEAYELLSSGKTPRPTPTPPPAYTAHYAEPKTATRGKSNWPTLMFAFVAVFAVTITVLLQRSGQSFQTQETAVEQPVNVAGDDSTRADTNARAEVNQVSRKSNTQEEAVEVAPVVIPTEPAEEVKTVTLTIDPESGLLAKEDCRLRTRMTYASDSAPSGYCNLNHAPPPKKGKIKSVAKWLESQ